MLSVPSTLRRAVMLCGYCAYAKATRYMSPTAEGTSTPAVLLMPTTKPA